ncbi:hypothetical protein [Streptomyces sp. UG1]|uniref:hypothetical protein n=1 Tax=Streptomyces sp. UG1 TaxID=3417652 RepID=UPI003CECCF13
MPDQPTVFDEDAGHYVHGAAITDASTAHALNATFSDTEVEAALDALGTKINGMLAALRSRGIIAKD